MTGKNEFVCSNKKNGAKPQRVDRFLQAKLGVFSLQNVRDLLASGAVRLITAEKTVVAKKGAMLRDGDRLLWEGMPDLRRLPIPDGAVPVITRFEDEHLVIVDKPARVATHPLSPLETGTLANALVALYPEIAGIGPHILQPGMPHRLDIGTSGLLVVAKTAAAYEALRRLWDERAVRKRYLGLVHGKVEERGEIKAPLAHAAGRSDRMIVVNADKRAKHRGRTLTAITRFVPQRGNSRFTLVHLEIPTGVMHQIRAHMRSIDHPLVGDVIYGRNTPTDQKLSGRHFLHASALELPHPVTGETMKLTSPLPEELEVVLKELLPE